MKLISADDDQIHNNFAILLEVDEQWLSQIEKDPKKVRNTEFLLQGMRSTGEHVHVIHLTLNDKVKIPFYVYRLLKHYLSVSWVSEEDKFFIRRR